ncbi:hypothetical protein DFR52_101258 [Hoeflea marina]|uniref:Uncharacterized protein n=1 Tax=Hoeflea marina TaxID=274592 RepID=A0A317PRK1_9HYPH|nr:hypothetical protein DFR52_101258 [Hoeflea marina]
MKREYLKPTLVKSAVTLQAVTAQVVISGPNENA